MTHLKRPYGVIGQLLCAEDKRDELIAILSQATREMPGCTNYTIAKDITDKNALWVTEVWESKESHQASLELPDVQEAIAKAKPLISGFGERFETEPVV